MHKKGLIVTPAEIRRKFGISEGTYLDMIDEDDFIQIVVPKILRDALV